MLLTSSYEGRVDLWAKLDSTRVEDLPDGGMGSVAVVSPTSDRKSVPIARAEFSDLDGVTVSVQICADGSGLLREIDIWKTDFTKLVRYPSKDLMLK